MQKRYRLCRREDFAKVYKGGRSVANHQFVLYYKENPKTTKIRLGVSASKKVGGAVQRNQIRRRVKEIVRRNMDEIKTGYDLILIVRAGAMKLDYIGLEKSIRHVMRKGGLMTSKRKK